MANHANSAEMLIRRNADIHHRDKVYGLQDPWSCQWIAQRYFDSASCKNDILALDSVVNMSVIWIVKVCCQNARSKCRVYDLYVSKDSRVSDCFLQIFIVYRLLCCLHSLPRYPTIYPFTHSLTHKHHTLTQCVITWMINPLISLSMYHRMTYWHLYIAFDYIALHNVALYY